MTPFPFESSEVETRHAQVSRLPANGRQFILSLPKGSTRTGFALGKQG